jgi:hypothetical protein
VDDVIGRALTGLPMHVPPQAIAEAGVATFAASRSLLPDGVWLTTSQAPWCELLAAS